MKKAAALIVAVAIAVVVLAGTGAIGKPTATATAVGARLLPVSAVTRSSAVLNGKLARLAGRASAARCRVGRAVSTDVPCATRPAFWFFQHRRVGSSKWISGPVKALGAIGRRQTLFVSDQVRGLAPQAAYDYRLCLRKYFGRRGLQHSDWCTRPHRFPTGGGDEHGQPAPTVRSLPAISGVPQAGRVLTASPGAWTGNPRFDYAWESCDGTGSNCALIAAPDSANYSLTDSDVGKTIRVTVVGSNASGAMWATSSATSPVQARDPGPPPPPVPVVSAVGPGSGPVAGGTSVTVTGSGFSAVSAVKFGGADAGSFHVDSDTQITASSPAGSAGTVDVTVISPDGTSATGSGDQFTFVPAPPPPPTVSKVSPASGPVAGGTSVTVSGSGFSAVSAVKFGGSDAGSFHVDSDTQITASSPAGSAGTVDVTVISPNGTSATGSGDQYTYAPVPVVSGLTPSSGFAAGGNTVTITGTGFTPGSTVKFGSASPGRLHVDNSMQITTTAPAGSGTVDVTVTTPGGTSVAGIGDRYTFIPAAIVTVTNTPGAALTTQLSTNSVWATMLDQTPNGQPELNALQAPYVRLHIGDDGGAPALPEITQNRWDFTNLDNLVNNVFGAGQKPLMNIKFAPDWMWTCYPNTITTGSAGSGSVADQSFQAFAQYMARLVSYYNKGSMTTETGQVINNPAGTSHAMTDWELWNEPDLTNETPCADPSGHSLSPAQYVTMWNAATAAMLQVDPTLKFVGPATAGAQFGSSSTTSNAYIDNLMTNSVTKPAAISFHGYGYWDNSVSDKLLFDGGDPNNPSSTCCGGITEMVNGVTTVRSTYPATPVWLTEVNVNASWGFDPSQLPRPATELGAAWWGALFAKLAPLGVGVIHQFDLVNGDPQFSLINSATGDPYVAYHVLQLLDQAFPPGSTLLSSTSSGGIESLAAKKPDGTMSILVVNRKLVSNDAGSTASPWSCGAGGVPTAVDVLLPALASSVSLQQIDKTNINCSTGAATAPATQTLTPALKTTVTFPGYGIALLTVR